MDEAQTAIDRINADECHRLRDLDGRDLNQWHRALDDMDKLGDTDGMLSVLYRIVSICETLVQYDTREPQPYWYEKIAALHHQRGEGAQRVTILERWLHEWEGREHARKEKIEQKHARALQAVRERH